MSRKLLLVAILFVAGAMIAVIGFWPQEAADPQRRGSTSVSPGTQEDTPMARLDGSPAGEIVSRSIEFAGGWHVWGDRRTVRYDKTTTTFGGGGEEVGSVSELHRYVLQPVLRIRIDKQVDGRNVTLIHDGQQAWKLVDGRVAEDEDDVNEAYNSTAGSHYVFGMPFKLTDPGAELRYQGAVALPDGEAESVAVIYGVGVGSAGGMHQWTYFFDPQDARLRANHLVYGAAEHEASFTQYADFADVDGWTMPLRRDTYQSDRQGIRGALQTTIINTNVAFDVDFDEGLFARPPGR